MLHGAAVGHAGAPRAPRQDQALPVRVRALRRPLRGRHAAGGAQVLPGGVSGAAAARAPAAGRRALALHGVRPAGARQQRGRCTTSSRQFSVNCGLGGRRWIREVSAGTHNQIHSEDESDSVGHRVSADLAARREGRAAVAW